MAPHAAPAIAGGIMLLLAGWLLRVNPRHEATRAFVVVLVARGMCLFSLSLTMLAGSVEVARVGAVLYAALSLTTIFGVVYFVGVYPARRWWMPRPPIGPLAVFVPLLALEVVIGIAPDLVRPMRLLTEPGPEAIIRWVMGSPQGPFGIVPTLLDLMMIVPAFILARDYLRTPRGKRRDTLRLVSLGFFAPAACSCLMAGALLQVRGAMPGTPDPSVFNYLEIAVFGLWFLLLPGMLVYLIAHAVRSHDAGTRRETALFAGILSVATVLGAATGLIDDPMDNLKAIAVMVGFWSALGAALVAYAVLRHSLFDIDVTLKVSFQRSTVAAVFVAVYFLVTEAATVWFSGVSGSDYWGIAAAALLLLVLHPLQAFAERLFGNLMPTARPLTQLDRAEQIAFYREHVDLMWMDGHLSPKDRLVLASLRARLGLDHETAERIELEVLAR